MGDFSILGIRIKELRNSMNKTQREFATLVGCTAATLSAYENGSKSPSLEIVKNIAEKTNVSIDWLCGLTNEKRHLSMLTTYTDVIKQIFLLQKTPNLNFEIIYQEEMKLPGVLIACENKEINDFFIEWSKIKKLYDEKIINDDMYNPWLSNKLKSMDKQIKNSKSGLLRLVKDMLTDFFS